MYGTSLSSSVSQSLTHTLHHRQQTQNGTAKRGASAGGKIEGLEGQTDSKMLADLVALG